MELNDNYPGSSFRGNFVWGGAMHLAWQELNDNILHEKLQLNTDDKIAIDLVDQFNTSLFSKKDVDDQCYYVQSGYGQKTVNIINSEIKRKFPDASFGDLNMSIGSKDVIACAFFLKAVQYALEFNKGNVFFNKKQVAGFKAINGDQKKMIEIIKYDNNDQFVIKLKLKDNSDELILGKGYDMSNPRPLLLEIIKHNKSDLPTLGHYDRFEAPKLHLDHQRVYKELIGKLLLNKQFKDYFIGQMFESIKFDMDEKGARVENRAVISLSRGAVFVEPAVKPKNFILDKPYWVVMKRTSSMNPYFILGVNNTNIMDIKGFHF